MKISPFQNFYIACRLPYDLAGLFGGPLITVIRNARAPRF
jgi:hypothetical protein